MLPRVCSYVVLTVPRGAASVVGRRGRSLLFGRLVVQGAQVPELGATVALCRPSPCVIGVPTEVRFAEPVDLRIEELTYNYMITVIRSGVVERYVYPKKVWNAVYDSVIEPLSRGRLSRQGVVLYGPPGTGKTSLAKTLADVEHLYVEEIRLETTLSMWLGQSEKQLFLALKRAEANEPAMALADEAEWLLGARYRQSQLEAHASVYSNLVRIVLSVVESWNRRGKLVLFVATTNVPPSTLDRALMRSGRLGQPINVPLPDYEAVYEFLRTEGVDEELADAWATKVVNLGLSMADVKLSILPALLQGREPTVAPQTEAGYRRYVLDIRAGREEALRVLKAVNDAYGDLGRVLRARMERNVQTVLWFCAPQPIATAFANALLMYYNKIPTVTLVDPRMLDSAIEAANSVGGVLVAPSSLSREVADLIRNNALAVAFVGEEHPRVDEPLAIHLDPDRLRLPSSVTRGEFARALAAIVLSFYGVEYTRRDLETLGYARDFRGFMRRLSMAASYGTEVRDLAV